MMARSRRSWISVFSRLARTNLTTNTRLRRQRPRRFLEEAIRQPHSQRRPRYPTPLCAECCRVHIAEGDLLTVRLTEGDGRSCGGRSVEKVKTFFPIRLKKLTLQPESDVASGYLEWPPTRLSPDILIVSSPHRERRSIQKRWVLMTELKAGEKWKRRLCKAAR